MKRLLACVGWGVPFGYLFHTRLHSKQDQLSWVLVHPLPVLFLAIAGHRPEHLLPMGAIAVLGLIGFQALYEIGYIDNDVFTTKRESDPTLRLSASAASFLESNFAFIAALRVGIFCLCILAAGWFKPAEMQIGLGPFLMLCVTTMIAFATHNRIRNRWNVLTYGVLATGRYTAVPLLAWGLAAPWLLLAALLMMPLPRTLEHATKPKYGFDGLRRMLAPFEVFRPAYYLIALLAFAAMSSLDTASLMGAATLTFFLVYRVGVLCAVRGKLVSPTVHQAYVKRAEKDEH